MGAVVEATKETFRDLVSDGPVLVDVWGPECRPCFALMPHVERFAAERPGLTVVKLEAPKARRLCMELRVMGLPAFLVFHNGEEAGRLSGADITPTALESWLDETLSSTGAEAGTSGGDNPR
jgi:thioredoxin 1